MSATEELRRLLDERGVEWRGGLPTETMVNEPIDTLYVERPDGRMHVYFRSYLTPEQAIDATLGRGMLTADDVRDLIERNSDASGGNGRDFHNGAYVAIADELNATLGRGTCHDVCEDDGYFKCSACGGKMHGWTEGDVAITYNSPAYCPNCGRKVVDA